MLIFVAHPYSQFISKEDYRNALQPIEQEILGTQFSYAFENLGAIHLLQDLKDMIRASRAGIFDVTTLNRNVLLEYGMSEALDKPNLLLVNTNFRATDMPADIAGIRYATYSNMYELRSVVAQFVREIANTDCGEHGKSIMRNILRVIEQVPNLTRQQIADRVNLDAQVISGILLHLIEANKVHQQIGTRRYFLGPRPTEQ